MSTANVSIRDKVAASLVHYEEENAKMRASVRRAYEDGRWASATPAERAATRRNFRINLAHRRELIAWLAAR